MNLINFTEEELIGNFYDKASPIDIKNTLVAGLEEVATAAQQAFWEWLNAPCTKHGKYKMHYCDSSPSLDYPLHCYQCPECIKQIELQLEVKKL